MTDRALGCLLIVALVLVTGALYVYLLVRLLGYVARMLSG